MESNQDRADAHRREQEDYGVFAGSVFADPKWFPKPGPTKKQVNAERQRTDEERRRILIEAGRHPGKYPAMLDVIWDAWRRAGSPRSFDVTVELMPDMLDRLHEVARGSDATREEIVRLALAEFLGIESTVPPAPQGAGPTRP